MHKVSTRILNMLSRKLNKTVFATIGATDANVEDDELEFLTEQAIRRALRKFFWRPRKRIRAELAQ